MLLVVYSAPRCPDGRDSRRRGATTLRWPSDVGAISKFDHPLSWRMITSETPQDWRALQADVGRILSESGFTVEVEKPIETVRGEVVVDVFAEETVKGRRLATLVECKNWASRVPKQVIHAFRTVVAGSGAHVGYIVSSEGFQSGAFAAADLTNLRLKTWAEFQGDFEETWIDAHLIPTITDRLDPLFSYTEPLVPGAFRDINEAAMECLAEMRQHHGPSGWLMMLFTPYAQSALRTGVPSLPLRSRASDELIATAPAAVLDASGYREFFSAALDHGEALIKEFRDVVGAGRTTSPEASSHDSANSQ